MRSTSLLAGALLVGSLVAACGPSGRGDDTGGGGDDNPGTDGGGGGGGGGDCSDAAKLIYVVGEDNVLAKFDPSTKTFTTIGTLTCPATPTVDPIFGIETPATPFSMGIDRNADAWVLYNSSEVFKVSTTNASCTATNFQAPSGLSLFGMGFSTVTSGGTADTLYIAGSDDPGAEGSSSTTKLATLDTSSMQTTMLGTVTGSPELTGTGSAELWGFFPGTSGARIEKLNKMTGAALETHQLANLSGQPVAWAFAFWGGDFWAFLAKGSETSTTVYHYDTTGTLKDMTSANGRLIVGAGVSTCAPVVIL